MLKLASTALYMCLGQIGEARDLKNEGKTTGEKPMLKDWFEAEWFDGVVKIPLSIEDSTLWYMDLTVYNPDYGV